MVRRWENESDSMPQAGHSIVHPFCKGEGSFIVDHPKKEKH